MGIRGPRINSIDLAYSSSTAGEILDLIEDRLIYLLRYELIFREVSL